MIANKKKGKIVDIEGTLKGSSKRGEGRDQRERISWWKMNGEERETKGIKERETEYALYPEQDIAWRVQCSGAARSCAKSLNPRAEK